MPIWEIFTTALSISKANALSIIKLLIPFMVLSGVFYVLVYFTITSGMPWWLLFLCIPITIVLFISAIVNVYRIFLREEGQDSKVKIFSFAQTEIKFLGVGILFCLGMLILSIIAMIPIAIFGGIFEAMALPSGIILFFGGLYVITAAIALAYFSCRLSMVFPAVVDGRKTVDLGEIWRLSSDNGWRLFFLIIVIPFIIQMGAAVILFILELPILMIVGEVFPTLQLVIMFAFELINFALSTFMYVLQIGLLSLSYKYFLSVMPEPDNDDSLTPLKLIPE